MYKENQTLKWLSAPKVDQLIYQAEKLYEITDNPTKGLVIELFQKLQTVAVFSDDERRELWLTAPRGSIEEIGDYENYLESGEVTFCIQITLYSTTFQHVSLFCTTTLRSPQMCSVILNSACQL